MTGSNASAWQCRSCGNRLRDRIIDLGQQPHPDELLGLDGATTAATARVDVWICGECGLVQLVGAGPESGHVVHGHRPARGVEGDPDTWIQGFIDAVPDGGLVADLDPVAMPSIDRPAGLILGGHALSHVDDLAAFMTAAIDILDDNGRLSLDFHHVLGLAQGQVDVLSHAHRSYLSLHAVEGLLERHGLVATAAVLDPEYGGTVRVIAQRHASDTHHRNDPMIEHIRRIEREARLARPEGYESLEGQVSRVCSELRDFLGAAVVRHSPVAGYGAAARGTTLLNFAGIGPELLPFIADRSLAKQNHLIPGARIPIVAPGEIDQRRPESILIMPWPLASEVSEQLSSTRAWGARLFVAVPRLEHVP